MIKTRFVSLINIDETFMREIFTLHGIPRIVILDQYDIFTSIFWKALFEGMDTQLKFQYYLSSKNRWEN